MKFLEKIRSLPERKRKVIFWLFFLPLAFLLFFLYGKHLSIKLKEVKIEKMSEEFQIPELKKQLENIPKFKIPFQK